MRKRYKDKDRSCGLCKPHKRGWAQRWKPKEGQFLEETEREIQDALMSSLFGGIGNACPDNIFLPIIVRPYRLSPARYRQSRPGGPTVHPLAPCDR